MGIVFETQCKSITGAFLYSDTHSVVPPCGQDVGPIIKDVPFLNRWAAIPVLGILAGITRIVLAKIHIIGHLLAATIYKDKDHLMHAAKGAAELLRGVIESTLLIGRVFVWLFDAPRLDRFDLYRNSRSNGYPIVCHAVFLIKISNPDSIASPLMNQQLLPIHNG